MTNLPSDPPAQTDKCANCGHDRRLHGMTQQPGSNWCIAHASGERATPFHSICNCEAFVEPASAEPAPPPTENHLSWCATGVDQSASCNCDAANRPVQEEAPAQEQRDADDLVQAFQEACEKCDRMGIERDSTYHPVAKERAILRNELRARLTAAPPETATAPLDTPALIVQEETLSEIFQAHASSLLIRYAEIEESHEGQWLKTDDEPFAVTYAEECRKIANTFRALASALPGLLEASRELNAAKQALKDANIGGIFDEFRDVPDALQQMVLHAEHQSATIADYDKSLSLSIRERETLTRENAKQEKALGEEIDNRDRLEDQITAVYYALGGPNEWSSHHDLGVEALAFAHRLTEELAEAKAAVGRLSSEKEEAIRSRDVEWERAQTARTEAATLRREKAQFLASREQAIQDIEALPIFNDSPFIHRDSVLSILRGNDG